MFWISKHDNYLTGAWLNFRTHYRNASCNGGLNGACQITPFEGLRTFRHSVFPVNKKPPCCGAIQFIIWGGYVRYRRSWGPLRRCLRARVAPSEVIVLTSLVGVSAWRRRAKEGLSFGLC